MAKKKFNEPYTLFSQEKHEKIDWTFEKEKVEQVKEYWSQEYCVGSIAETLKISEFSVMLILMDLLYIGELEQRRSGLLRGRVA